MFAHQATCVAVKGRGILIEGSPGSGKSSLALVLIDRGARLVGDDSLMLEACDGRLIAHPHPRTQGLIEVRNLGLLGQDICEHVPVALVLVLDAQAPRFIESSESCERFGIPLPLVRLWPGSPVQHIKAELALERFGLPLSISGQTAQCRVHDRPGSD